MSTMTKKPQVPMDRIFLQGEARERIQRWTEELNQKFRGLRLSKTDLVSFFILSRPGTLFSDEAQKIRDAHFDEVRFAAWVLKEAKEAQKRGDGASLKELFSSAVVTAKRSSKRRKAADPAQDEQKSDAGAEGGDAL